MLRWGGRFAHSAWRKIGATKVSSQLIQRQLVLLLLQIELCLELTTLLSQQVKFFLLLLELVCIRDKVVANVGLRRLQR
jgi:hypothetical protein